MATNVLIDIKTATKAECIAKANGLFNMSLRAEAANKPNLIEASFKKACEFELAAFDGRV